ncbi:hypothetical protein KORDIASMS9_02423 [Kordia sp. SMS9]|nr:hypothetical protein [Kordia sp. SMS9]AXG70184.1 hypothetical protein KORDIASMS9_02423 [Kordia sp. SMS9]
MIQKLKTFEIKNASQITGGEETTTEVTVNKAKMADKAMNAMTQYISS